MTRSQMLNALMPAANRAVVRGEFPSAHNDTPAGREANARIIANYATTDMLLAGRTLLLPMDEVNDALGISTPVRRDRAA